MMAEIKPEVRHDSKHGACELASFVVGGFPLVIALVITGALMQSGFWSTIALLIGLPVAFLIMSIVSRDPTCGSCGRTICQKILEPDSDTGKLSYYCAECNIRWITDLNAPGHSNCGGI